MSKPHNLSQSRLGECSGNLIDLDGLDYSAQLHACSAQIFQHFAHHEALLFRGQIGHQAEYAMTLMKDFFQAQAAARCVYGKLANAHSNHNSHNDDNHPLWAAYTPFALEQTHGNPDRKATLDLYLQDNYSYDYFCDNARYTLDDAWIAQTVDAKLQQVLRAINANILQFCADLLRVLQANQVLDLNADLMHGFSASPNYLIRLIHYPPLPDADISYVLGPHGDDDLLAVVFNQSSKSCCLEVLGQNDVWSAIEIPRHGFTVLPGKLLEVLSGGKVRAIEHRVKWLSDNERLTINLNYGVAQQYWDHPAGATTIRDYYLQTCADKYRMV
jgi:isopenicillin N synthase-like dioxygenase